MHRAIAEMHGENSAYLCENSVNLCVKTNRKESKNVKPFATHAQHNALTKGETEKSLIGREARRGG